MLPHAVIIDTEIIRNSPEQFIYSGMGDLFCKVTSIFDWKLAFKKVHEYVNDFAAVITNNALDAFVHYAHKDIMCLEFIRVVAGSLMMSGIAMEIAGSSRPASGSEHLISHAYDKIATKPSLHGLQVGVASYVVSYLQEETYETLKTIIQECGFAAYMSKHKLNKKDFMDAVKFAPNIKEHYYTILSEKDSIKKLIDFVEKDSLINQMLI
jgi:glycerol-1-phosphate dehydrogenase [NAD(P)+]